MRPAPPVSMAEACDWALDRLDRGLAVADLAARAHLRQPVFARRFTAEMGLPPSRWLALARVERAKELLERPDLSLGDVARTAGFGTPANLRTRFRQETGMAPRTYRDAHHGTPRPE